MSVANDATEGVWPAILTWRAHDDTRMESVRIQMSGNRIKAYGRIVAAASATNPAFSAAYDLVTDESGTTKRLSLTVALAERERQLSVARDEENMWLVTGHQGQGQTRGHFEGAVDVDVIFSPFFNALPIRRFGLQRQADSLSLPIIYVSLPDLTLQATTVTYDSPGPGGGIRVGSPAGETIVTVDNNGFIVDYPGLAERI